MLRNMLIIKFDEKWWNSLNKDKEEMQELFFIAQI